ncbi:hypothetical protein SAMN05216548_11215 [Faunimonas pinastri]|uniref:Uncharacterized protein n=1 Tax=Faunimonas pinastri TaxID=1855383 RepID=A0A1H9LT93_9HYPH|nr:hypothetical protein [Faunimonas pinastri]SER14732.1 hypothetical protein SAMN05216548_11215 [Faunimonas pinastri]
MTPLHSIADRPRWVLGLGLLCSVGLVVAGLFHPGTALRAYLVGWLFWLSFPIGATVLLLIHALTGGRWGEAVRPVLAPVALTMPLAALASLPVLIGAHAIYGWSEPEELRSAVVHFYMNVPGFIARSVVVLVLWSLLALLAARRRPSPLIAGIGLIVYGVTVSFSVTDWAMSVQEKWFSTLFPAIIAISQILAAIGLATLFHPADEDGESTGDLAGLLIAGLLGVTYLGFMQAIVMWAGNVPEKVAWYLPRIAGGWRVVLILAFGLGAALPFLALIMEPVRQSPFWTRLAAFAVLVGLMLHTLWLVAPTFVDVPAWLLALAVAAPGLLWLGALGLALPFRAEKPASPMEARHG